MHQDDTMRLLITVTKLLAFVLAALTVIMWLWPETLRGMLFGAEPGSLAITWDSWGWLALGWFALVGSWLLLVVIIVLLLPAVNESPRRAATEPSREVTRETQPTAHR